MNSEDFFVFFYSALIILGVLLSLIPAYIASKKGKNFWLWWISTASVFTVLLFVLIKTEAISSLVYLLAILLVASILAILPNSERIKIVFPFPSNLSAETRLDRLKNALLFVFGLVVLLFIGAVLYYYLISNGKNYWPYTEKTYFVTLGSMFFIACFGLTSFVFIVSERRILYILTSILLTFFLARPFLLKPSRAYGILGLTSFMIKRDFFLGVAITDLMNSLIAGIFVLIGICSLFTTVAILINDRYKISDAIIAFIHHHHSDFDPPYIHFSKIPATPILVFYPLYLIFFKVFFHPTEGWIFLIPLVWLCLILPMFLFSFAGIILSTLAIGMSVSQKKPLYALCILSCGILASWKGVSASWYQDFFGLPGTLLVFYGATTGLIALILWVISDYRGKSGSDGAQP